MLIKLLLNILIRVTQVSLAVFQFFFFQTEITLVKPIASGPKSSAVSRIQFGVHLCQVLIK